MKKKLSLTSSPYGTWGTLQLSDGTMPEFRFNGHGYGVTPDDEQHYLEIAYKGNTGAQHGLGVIYLEKGDLIQALFWFCAAEHNEVEQASSDLNYLVANNQNPQFVQQWVNYHRDQVARNPVYRETFDDIINEMR